MRRVFKFFATSGEKQTLLSDKKKKKISMAHGYQDLDWKDWKEYNLSERSSFIRCYIGNAYGLLSGVEIGL